MACERSVSYQFSLVLFLLIFLFSVLFNLFISRMTFRACQGSVSYFSPAGSACAIACAGETVALSHDPEVGNGNEGISILQLGGCCERRIRPAAPGH